MFIIQQNSAIITRIKKEISIPQPLPKETGLLPLALKQTRKKIHGIVSNLFINLLTSEPTTLCTAEDLTQPRLCYSALISTNLL